MHLPPRCERVAVSADRHLRHVEPGAQVGDAHELLLADLGQHALAPERCRDRPLRLDAHGRAAGWGSTTVKSVSRPIGSLATESTPSLRAASSGATSFRNSPSPVSTLARIFIVPDARCS